MSNELATEKSKTDLENSVSWFLADKLSATTAIATSKYLTNDNLLVYLTRCDVADSSAPRIKVQVLRRVSGGVHETSYQLFADHRFVRGENNMIFGASDKKTDSAVDGAEVTEGEMQELLQLVNGLNEARPAL